MATTALTATRQIHLGLRKAGRVHRGHGDAREGQLRGDGDARAGQDTAHDPRQRQRLRRTSRHLPGRRVAHLIALRLARRRPRGPSGFSPSPPNLAPLLSFRPSGTADGASKTLAQTQPLFFLLLMAIDKAQWAACSTALMLVYRCN